MALSVPGFVCTEDGLVEWTPTIEYLNKTVDVLLYVRDDATPFGVGIQSYQISVGTDRENENPIIYENAPLSFDIPAGWNTADPNVTPSIIAPYSRKR